MSKDPVKKIRLDTDSVMNQLKGDLFPEDGWGTFLDPDIKNFFDALFLESDAQRSDVIKKAGISRTYGYQIMNGSRLGKRDYYLSLSFALGLDLRMTQRLLAVTHSGSLHPLIKRDAAFIFALNHSYDNDELYSFLLKHNLKPLDTGIQ